MRLALVERWLRIAAFVGVFLLLVVGGAWAPYVVVVLLIATIPVLVMAGVSWEMVREPTSIIFLTAFVLLVLAFAITAQRGQDVLYAFNFIMALLFIPTAVLMRRGATANASVIVATWALAGVLLALGYSLMEALVLGIRPGQSLPDTVKVANTATLLGFVALIGVRESVGRQRLIYLLGPPAAIAVTVLTSQRGVMVAFPVLLAIAVFGLAASRRQAIALAAAGAAGLVALALALIQFGGPRFSRLPAQALEVLAGARTGSGSIDLRLDMWRGAWNAFLEQPWFGYGWIRLGPAAVERLPPEATLRRAQHLHSDIANFATAAGVVGLVALALFLAAPVVGAAMSPRDRQYGSRLMACCVLSATYFGAGLTGIMIGYELHTTFYFAMAAILLGYCRDPAPVVAGASGPVTDRAATQA